MGCSLTGDGRNVERSVVVLVKPGTDDGMWSGVIYLVPEA